MYEDSNIDGFIFYVSLSSIWIFHLLLSFQGCIFLLFDTPLLKFLRGDYSHAAPFKMYYVGFRTPPI